MFKRKRSTEDFEEEIRAHLELEAEELKSEGLSDEDAYRKARLAFGNVSVARERFYLRSRAVWCENLIRDVKFAVRQLRKNPGFSLTSILVLALGIGASVAIFSFVDAALIRPLPYVRPQQLVHVSERDISVSHANLSYLDYVDWKRMNTVLSSFDAFAGWNPLLHTPAGAEPFQGERVTSGFFQTLGVAPVLGRGFRPQEEISGSPHVVMLSYGIWQQRFDGRRDVIGQSVQLSGLPYTVIGVLPKGFDFAPAHGAVFWTSLRPDNDCDKLRDCHYFYAVGRLKEGVSLQKAAADMQSIARQLEMQYPNTNRGRGASVVSLSEQIVGDIRPILLLLLSGAGLLLLIACINVSSLLIVRSEGRKREIAVRGALGAPRARIAYQFATEGIVLVGCGSLTGLVIAEGVMQVLHHCISKELMANLPFFQDLGINTHVLAFTGGLTLLVALLFSIVPILHLSISELRDGLAEGGRTSAGTFWRRVGERLVVFELATTMVLLTGAGLLGKSLYRLLHVDVGFQTDHLATLRVRLPDMEFPKEAEQIAFIHRLLDRVKSLPGVQGAAVTSVLPVSCNCNTDWMRIVGKPYDGSHITTNARNVSSEFFNVLRVRLLAGRIFNDADDASRSKVMIVNRSFARKYFPGEDPIGKRVGDSTLSPSSMKQIVGVIDDFKDASLDEEQQPAAYYPYYQDGSSGFSLIVRTSQDERPILSALTAAIHQLNENVGVDQEVGMIQRINESTSVYFRRSTAYLVGGFATLALLLSSVGLYGVIAYSVGRRTREIGVRMALGAQRKSVHRMVLQEAVWLAAMGIGIGTVCALAAGNFLRELLFGVRTWDVPTLIVVALTLGIAALLASYLPARHASSVNPIEALRTE